MKQANPGRSVCELGSMIGRMWRELGDADKHPYFDSFTNAKVRVVLCSFWRIGYANSKLSNFVKRKILSTNVHKMSIRTVPHRVVENTKPVLIYFY